MRLTNCRLLCVRFNLENQVSFQALTANDLDVSWLIPQYLTWCLILNPFGVEGLITSSLDRALHRSEFGLRLVGYPTGVLQELFDRPASTS